MPEKEIKENEEEVTFEETDEDGELSQRDLVKKLREKIKILESEKKEYLDLSQRTLADYANLKKETEENRKKDLKFATKSFIIELLPVLDSYDMARGNTEAWNKVDNNWRIGIEYIFNQLLSILEAEGVVRFGNKGDIFNPDIHESVELVKVDDESENDKILIVLQSGYKMGDQILRPARVKVGQK